MVTARWGRAEFAPEPTAVKVRWGRGAFEGTTVVVPLVRWGRATLEGTAAVFLDALAPITVEPETVVTLHAVLTGGGTADSYTFRRISGPAVTFVGTGATRSFTAPSTVPPGATLVIGVTATVEGTTSPERTIVVTLQPQIAWRYSSGAWIGKRPTVPITA